MWLLRAGWMWNTGEDMVPAGSWSQSRPQRHVPRMRGETQLQAFVTSQVYPPAPRDRSLCVAKNPGVGMMSWGVIPLPARDIWSSPALTNHGWPPAFDPATEWEFRKDEPSRYGTVHAWCRNVFVDT